VSSAITSGKWDASLWIFSEELEYWGTLDGGLNSILQANYGETWDMESCPQ
jgi:hypothetical protein